MMCASGGFMDETIISLMSESELCAAMGARLIHPQNRSFHSISTDSRKTTPDDLFIALSGERFDAHDFVPDVIQKGCRGILVSRELDVPEDVAMYIVPDVLKAFGMLADAVLEKRRSMGSFTTYAITGSNGKTTTKELLTLLLQAQGHHVLKTEGNFNNFVGLPMTVLNLRRDHDVAVLEMGANAPGEIAYLSGLGKPDIAIITCIGSAHLEGFGSLEGVAKAKGEMIFSPRLKKIVLPSQTRCYFENNIPSTVSAIWVGDETSRENIRIQNVRSHLDGIEFDLVDDAEQMHIRLPLLGSHNAGNLARAYAALCGTKLSENDINRAIEKIRLPSGRLERWTNEAGISFLHDAYNANPSSMKEALQLMSQFKSPKYLILGDMRELGRDSDQLHEALGKSAADIHPERILCVGSSAQHIRSGALSAGYDASRIFCTTTDDLGKGLDWLSQTLHKDDLCLIKGSRGVRLERVLEYFNAQRLL